MFTKEVFMNRREASKIETRKLIIAATKKLLQEKKVNECTMRSIAEEAGVSAASIVVHFKNKYALFEETLGEDIDHTTDKAIATLPLEGDLADKVVHIWRTMYIFYGTKRDLYRPLIRSTVFEPENQTPFLTRQTDVFLTFLEELINKEKAAGRITPSLDSAIMARTLFALYFGALIMFYRNATMSPREATGLVAAMTRQALAGHFTNCTEE